MNRVLIGIWHTVSWMGRHGGLLIALLVGVGIWMVVGEVRIAGSHRAAVAVRLKPGDLAAA